MRQRTSTASKRHPPFNRLHDNHNGRPTRLAAALQDFALDPAAVTMERRTT
ncbi:hypothetical protein [Dokdonella sp.]|uniref:hypothetical protein n=1 Tax=Dokdonella sp. TaxID=2291710 RepID=UPI003529A147